jgi:TPP-dependent pyruvate/acetoin dehydrogenase alpha subunit
MTYIGDGASSIGDFHEGLNFAAVRRLPFILIIENNQFAYSTPTRLQFACRRLADRAIGYGIPGECIDGTDVIAVYEACKRAVDRARAGDGPTLIETQTMRMRGHSEHDDAFYVPKAMLDEWARKDPINRFERRLRDEGILTDVDKAAIDERIAREIEEALLFAEQSPWPTPEDAATGVYAL